MNIELVENLDAGVVGWENQFGEREGRFFLAPDGAVFYRSPFDARTWIVGDDVPQFRSAALAWNTYTASVRGQSENEQLKAIVTLRSALQNLRLLTEPESFWGQLLEQAENGQL